MSAPRCDDNVSRTVSILTLSTRIAESGSITHLPENVRPVGWTALYAGADESWERVAEERGYPDTAGSSLVKLWPSACCVACRSARTGMRVGRGDVGGGGRRGGAS